MAISKSFLTDSLAVGVVTQTINSINALIPDVTVKGELAGLVSASTAEYYYNLAPAVAVADAGADFNTSQVGSKKAVMPLTRALQMDEKVPGFAIETTSVDVLNDRIAKGAIAMANKAGSLFIADLLSLSQAKTYTNGASFYDAVVEGIQLFAQGSSAKVGGQVDTTFSNAANGVQPTTLIVGDAGRSKLFKSEAFQRLIGDANQGAIPGLIGTMLGLRVVYSQHLTGVDFILLNAEGVAFPYSLNTLRVVESEDFNGVRVQGEIVLPDAGVYSILPIDSFSMKFTMAAGQ
jgi:hypothetical protein